VAVLERPSCGSATGSIESASSSTSRRCSARGHARAHPPQDPRCAVRGCDRRAVAGPLANQLLVLDLSHGTITPRDVEVLAGMKDRFTQLRELWVPMAAMWGGGGKALEGTAKHVIGDQRSPLDNLEHELGVDDSDPSHYDEVEE
jgi:hypothetical protein